MLDIKGTTSKKLIAYIDRVVMHLELEYANIEFTVQATCNSGAGGYCFGDSDDIQVEIARYDAQGKLPKENFQTNIAHELIHAQQLVTGQMINKGINLITNDDGELAMINVVEWDGTDISGVKYEDQPWEIDAYGREEAVYNYCK